MTYASPRIQVNATLRNEDTSVQKSWTLAEDFTLGSLLHTIRRIHPEYSLVLLAIDLEQEPKMPQ